MKAVSIHQPWAWAILHAAPERKNIENRSWATRHRGPLLVHAALSLKSLDAQRAAHWRTVFGVELPRREALVFGALLGTVDVIDCVQVGAGGEAGLDDQQAHDEARTNGHEPIQRSDAVGATPE